MPRGLRMVFIGLVILFFLTGLVFAFVSARFVSFSINNEISGKKFAISPILVNIFIIKEKYKVSVNNVQINYTSEIQPLSQLYSGQDKILIQSFNRKIDGQKLTIWVYYNPQTLGNILKDEYRLEKDVFVNLCLSFNKGWDPAKCYSQVIEYEKWAGSYKLGPALYQDTGNKLSFRLVKPVYAAASCNGTIFCGAYTTVCSCPGYPSDNSCVANNQQCGIFRTALCTCDQTCNQNAYNSLDCSSMTPFGEIACNSSGVASCYSGGECPIDQPHCSWSCPLTNGTWSACSGCSRTCNGASCGGTCGVQPTCVVDGTWHASCNINSGCGRSCDGSACGGSCSGSAPSCVVNGTWGSWSSCYIGGGGLCIHDRACNGASCGGTCSGNSWEECATGACCSVTSWGACGGAACGQTGTQTSNCNTTRSCQMPACCSPVQGTPSAWSPLTCSPDCGQTQTRTCNGASCGGNCNGAALTQTCSGTDLGTPGQVTIVSPSGSVASPTVVGSPVALTWNNNETSHTSTDHYEYRLYNVTTSSWIAGGASSGVSIGGGPTMTTFSVNATTGNTYYWQVRAVNDKCPANGNWSAAGYFKVNSAPTIVSIVVADSGLATVANDNGTDNHICKSQFTGKAAVFKIVISDPDGVGDSGVPPVIHWNGNNYNTSWTAPSGGNNTAKTAVIDYSAGGGAPQLLHDVTATYSDKTGLAAANNGTMLMRWKVWDCNVSTSGNIYEIDQGNVCINNSKTLATADLNFTGVNFHRISPSIDVFISSAGSPNAYSGDLTWGNEYLTSLPGINGSPPTSLEVNTSGTCVNLQFMLDQTVVDAYIASPQIKIDLGSVRNQSPWWQALGGGVMARSQISNRVPITCVGACTPAIGILGVGTSSDGVILGQTINNTFGFYTSPRNIYKTGINGKGENTSYIDLYNKLYVEAGVGTTSIIDSGGTGVVFVDGDLNITSDNVVPVGKFLMVVVNGNIIINNNVNTVEGVLMSDDGMVIGGTSNTALNINGTIYSGGTVDISRGYATTLNNNTSAAVKFNYRPDLLFNMPATVSRVLSKWGVGQ